MCKEWICNWLCNSNRKIPKPDIVGRIEASELYSILKAEFGEEAVILLSDNYYELSTKESFERFLENDETNKYVYSSDVLDCDDYTCALVGSASIPGWSGVPIGTCWLKIPLHAVNVFIDEDKTIWMVEPMNDYIFRIDEKGDWKVNIVWI